MFGVPVTDPVLPSWGECLVTVPIILVEDAFVKKNLVLLIDVPIHHVPVGIGGHIVLLPHLAHLLLRKQGTHPVEEGTFPQVVVRGPANSFPRHILHGYLALLPDLTAVGNGLLLAVDHADSLLVIGGTAVVDEPRLEAHGRAALLVKPDSAMADEDFEFVLATRMSFAVEVVSALQFTPMLSQFHPKQLRTVP